MSEHPKTGAGAGGCSKPWGIGVILALRCLPIAPGLSHGNNAGLLADFSWLLVQHLLQYSEISAVGVIFRERQAGRLGLSPHLALRDVIAYG